VTGARKDIAVSPVKASVLSLSYYISTFFSTLIICVVALVACLLYMVNVGWYLSFTDIVLLILDVFLLSLFGTALSSVVNYFLSTQGQISAVGSIVSSCYGFICGAYMPISSFSEGLRNVLSFSPGTYATSLIRNHSLKGVFTEMENINLPAELINGIKDAVDCNIYFFDEKVSISVMYAVIGVTISILMVIYILMNKIKKTA
jgi:multidrug/hemolysin transport system permease protein